MRAYTKPVGVPGLWRRWKACVERDGQIYESEEVFMYEARADRRAQSMRKLIADIFRFDVSSIDVVLKDNRIRRA